MKQIQRIAVGTVALVCASLWSPAAHSQAAIEDSSAVGTAVMIVNADVDSAHVLLDGTFVGRTPLTLDSLAPGAHQLVVQHPDLPNWLTPALAESVFTAAGDTQRVRILFPRRLMISSTPYGAQVLVGDSAYGTTPLLLKIPPGGEIGSITLRKEGYQPLTADVDIARRGVFSVTLTPIWQREDRPGPVFNGVEPGSSRSVPLYVSGVATVLSGIAAMYFKTQADERFTEYNRTGNPDLLSQTHQLDTAAGITLAATQVGLAVFTYFLLSE